MDTQIFLLMVSAVVFVLCIPLVLKLVPPNRLYGFRTCKTLSSPDIWYPANVFSGYALMLAAAVTALIISCVPQVSELQAAAILVVLLICATAASFAYLMRIVQHS
jgi:uncharacterized membrane protein